MDCCKTDLIYSKALNDGCMLLSSWYKQNVTVFSKFINVQNSNECDTEIQFKESLFVKASDLLVRFNFCLYSLIIIKHISMTTAICNNQ